jgi:hypothetical protein
MSFGNSGSNWRIFHTSLSTTPTLHLYDYNCTTRCACWTNCNCNSCNPIDYYSKSFLYIFAIYKIMFKLTVQMLQAAVVVDGGAIPLCSFTIISCFKVFVVVVAAVFVVERPVIPQNSYPNSTIMLHWSLNRLLNGVPFINLLKDWSRRIKRGG